MTKDLKKRIRTSILLFIIAISCIFLHSAIFIAGLLIICYLAFTEASIILCRIYKNKILSNTFILFYLLAIFSSTTIDLHTLSGPVFFLYILSICICSDVGGYIVGKKFRGIKLTKISPNKTISGSLGSFIFSIIPLLIFNSYDSLNYSLKLSNFLFCLEASLVCQLGDLLISYLKRKAKVKDTGNILPGHGGILDRIDGMIFVFPFVYFYQFGFINYFLIFTNLIKS
jgi:phosphatidate cytidylyltransferase